MVSPKLVDVKRRLEATLWEFGLPLYMLSDNGPPFGSHGLGRLSRLSVWLPRLGAQPVLIEPGRPDQNGRHERFHETLMAETASPPRATISAQQASLTRFQTIYNDDRPHEALGMRVPAELWDFSPRSMPATLLEHEYPEGFEARRVRSDGTMKWAGGRVFVGEAMTREMIGVEAIDEGLYHVHLGPKKLGSLHERSGTIVPWAGEPKAESVTHVPGHEET